MVMMTVPNQTMRRSDRTDIVDLVRRAIVQLQPGVDQMGEDWPQLTVQQLRVMRILYVEGPTRVSALAKRLQVSAPTVTGILDRLVQRGMTTREADPHDRRVVLNVLTPSGRRVIDTLHPVQPEYLDTLVGRLASDDRRKLAEGLTSLLAAAESGRA